MFRNIPAALRCARTVGIALAIVASSALGANGQTHKVCAPPGMLDTNTEGIVLWHDYGSYSLYRVSDTALSQLPSETRDRLILLDDLDRLSINGVDIAPLHAHAQGAAAPATASAGESGGSAAQMLRITPPPPGSTPPEEPQVIGPALHLVQFVGPVKEEWLEAVEATGATLIQYIATNGYLVWADDESRTQLNRMAEEGLFLQLSGSHSPSLKIGPALSSRLGSDGGEVTVVIQMYRHEEGKETEALVEELASELLSEWTPVLGYQNIVVVMRQGDVGEVASRPDVFWIEERLERTRMDEVQGQILAGNLNAAQSGPEGPGYLSWLDSLGFSMNPADYPIVDVTDDGIGNGTVNSGDPTLHQFGDLTNPTRLAYVANCTSSADGGGPDGHGHINVSIAGGYDMRSGFPFQDPLGYQRGLGVNPYGRFAGTRIFDPGFNQSACGGTDAGQIKSIQDNGALISSNSWGCILCAGSYDDSSQAFDAGVRDADREEPGNQEMIFIFSAGNSGPGSGTVGTPSNAKNVITVGASENQRPSDEDGAWTDGCSIGPSGADDAMDVISFSSRGPSPGSRVKPELIAPGTHISGTASTHPSYGGNAVCDPYRPSGQTVYASSSGTSHSTPAVAGAASLAYWWLDDTYGIAAPSPALMKAYLIAHPTYLTGVGANDTLPSNSQGYGMPDMTAMFDDAAKYLVDQSITFDNSGETWTWLGATVDPSKPVRIVLAYTDAPGAVGTSPQVNDLNLAASVGGTTYLGNVFSGQWSVTGGSADPFNNYEVIFLAPGVSGAIDITVTAFNIGGDGVPNSGDGTDQDFALVCYNCAQTPTFSVNAEPEEFNVCAPADAVYDVEVGSILGFSDAVTLSAGGNPAGTTAGFSINPVIPAGSSTLTIGNTGAAAAGSHAIDVTGTSTTAGSRTDTVILNLYDIVPSAPTLWTPADGATDLPYQPVFSWTAVPQAAGYLLEVATDAGMTNVVYAAGETGTSHKAAVPLSASTTYYWRITASNVCGSAISTTFSFTVQSTSFPCNGSAVDFEDGIPSDWTVVDNTGGTGIVWTTTADPACEVSNYTNGSGEAACADSDAAGYGAPPYDTELVTPPIDMTAVGAAVVDVKAYYNDISTGLNDRFEMDVWDGTTWTNELSWDEDHMPEDFSMNLSAYAGLPVVQLRFRYFGDGYDWYALVDDVDLTCVAPGPPVIEIDPAVVTWSQAPDKVGVVELIFPEDYWKCDPPCTLLVTNSGGSPLEWTILEDDTACDSPTDIPWMSLSPDTSTTVPLASTRVYMTIDSAGLAFGDYAANLCVESDDPATPLIQVPVNLTVEEPTGVLECNGEMIGFEDGIPSAWTVLDNTGGTGIVWTTTADPACEIPNRTNGSGEAACADSDAAGYPAVPYDTELWSNTIDLTSWSVVVLDVKAYYNDLNAGYNDRFEVDVWDGSVWTNELSWDEDHLPEDFTLNLSAYAGLPSVRIRLRYFGNGFDLYAQADDIALTCSPAGPPAIEVDPAMVNWSQAPDKVEQVLLPHFDPPPTTLRITNTGGSVLNWNIVEDDTACDSPADIPWMSMSPDAGAIVPLESGDSIMTVDSTGLTPGLYTANLCLWSDDPVTPLVQIPVNLTVEEPTGVLECNGEMIGFEDGIPSAWTVLDNTGGTGIVWTTTADPACGIPNRTNGSGEAACADSDAAGYPAVPYDTELWSNTIDLTGWSIVVLDVKAYYNDISTGYNDRFEVDVWDGSVWTNELSWDEDHLPEDFTLNLSAYAGLPSVRIRLRYFGNGYDWYAQADDITLTCASPSPPVIGVDPAALSSAQGPDVQNTEPLHITNSGGSALNWNIVEDDSACDSPADIPWLSVAPDTGATMPLDGAIVDVTFDSTGLTPGDYTANLCVNSDDPDTPLVQVPVSLTVLAPLVLACNDPVIGFDSGIPSGWQIIDNEGSGVVWSDIAGSGETGNYTGGAGDAASASSDRFGVAEFDTEMRTAAFDLTGWLPSDTLSLGYLANYQNYAAYDFLDLDISADGGATWTTLLSWNEDHGSFRGTLGEAVSISLADYAGLSGLKLRWHYYDPGTGDYDWYAQIDDVALSCTHLPLIGVVKTATPSTVPEPGANVQFTIVVTNDGLADLTIDSLTDSDFDLATHCPDAVGTSLAPGEAYTCVFTEFIAGNAGYHHANTAIAAGSDDSSLVDTGSDGAAADVFDVAPVISVSKDAPPYAYQGDAVVFAVTIANDSVATDPVVITSIVDDVYGDLTTVHDDVLATDCATGVVIPPGDSYSCSFTATVPDDLVGDQTDTVTVTGQDDEGTTASHSDDATVTILPQSAATDSSLCLFDRYPETEPREFRLLFTPDVQNMPRFKLTASNPGQFYYGAFHIGDGPAAFELTVPYPFVTQGAMPVHVYSGVSVYVNDDGVTCFMPGAEEVSYAELITIDDHVDTDSDGKPDSATIAIAGVPAVGGFAYLNIHLDYGLKGGDDRYDKAVNPDGTEDAVDFDTGEMLIADRTVYPFAAVVNSDALIGDSLVNDNEFKRIPGVAGFVWDGMGDPIEGALVRLIIPPQVRFDEPYLEAVSDEDGWYMIEYKHKGRPTDYPIEVWIGGSLEVQDSVMLKGNAFAEMHFTVLSP